jgi:hypothetical protein
METQFINSTWFLTNDKSWNSKVPTMRLGYNDKYHLGDLKIWGEDCYALLCTLLLDVVYDPWIKGPLQLWSYTLNRQEHDAI